MPLNLASLTEKVASLKFEFAGEVVRLEYYPHKITPAYMSALRKISDSEKVEQEDSDTEKSADDTNTDAKMVSELLVGWDVMAGDQPFPPTYENLLTAPQALVSRVALEILQEVGKSAMPKALKK